MFLSFIVNTCKVIFVTISVGMEAGDDKSTGNVSEVGWFILSEEQQHIGPYAVSELRG